MSTITREFPLPTFIFSRPTLEKVSKAEDGVYFLCGQGRDWVVGFLQDGSFTGKEFSSF